MEFPSRLEPTKLAPLDSPMDNADFFLEFDSLLHWVDAGSESISPRVTNRAPRQRVRPRAAVKPPREEQPMSLNELERLLRKTDRNRQIHPTKDVERKPQLIETCRENLKRKRAKDKIQDLKDELIELEKSLLRLEKQTNENVSDDAAANSIRSSVHDRVESKRRKHNPKAQEAKIESADVCDGARRQRPIPRAMKMALHETHAIPASISTLPKSTADQEVAKCIFDGLGRNLDSQYQQIGAIWRACGLASSNIEIQANERVAKDDSGAAVLEHVHARVSPFSVDALARIVWRDAKRGVFTPTDGEMKVCKAMGNTLYTTVTDTLRVEKLSAAAVTVSTHLVLKRFTDEHRVVFVWESAVKIDGAVTARFTEHGWHMIRDASPSKNMAACISQTYIRAFPACGSTNCFEDQSVDRERIMAVQEICHHNIEMLQQIAENQLMDESLGVPKRKP